MFNDGIWSNRYKSLKILCLAENVTYGLSGLFLFVSGVIVIIKGKKEEQWHFEEYFNSVREFQELLLLFFNSKVS